MPEHGMVYGYAAHDRSTLDVVDEQTWTEEDEDFVLYLCPYCLDYIDGYYRRTWEQMLCFSEIADKAD